MLAAVIFTLTLVVILGLFLGFCCEKQCCDEHPYTYVPKSLNVSWKAACLKFLSVDKMPF
jgi:hypothetical protein